MIESSTNSVRTPLISFWYELRRSRSFVRKHGAIEDLVNDIQVISDNAKTHVAPGLYFNEDFASLRGSLISWGSFHSRDSNGESQPQGSSLRNTPCTPRQWDRDKDSVVGFGNTKKDRWGSNSSSPSSYGYAGTPSTASMSSVSANSTPYPTEHNISSAEGLLNNMELTDKLAMMLPFHDSFRARRGSCESGDSSSVETPLNIPRRRESVEKTFRSNSFDSQSNSSTSSLTIPTRRVSIDTGTSISPSNEDEPQSSSVDTAMVMPQRRISDTSTSSSSSFTDRPGGDLPIVPRRRASGESVSSAPSNPFDSEHFSHRSSMESIQESFADGDEDSQVGFSTFSTLPDSRDSIFLVNGMRQCFRRSSMESIQEAFVDWEGGEQDASSISGVSPQRSGESNEDSQSNFSFSETNDTTLKIPTRRISVDSSDDAERSSEPAAKSQRSSLTRGKRLSMESIPEQIEAGSQLQEISSPLQKYSKSNVEYPLRKPPTRTDSRELALHRRYERRHAIMAQVHACINGDIGQEDEECILSSTALPPLIDVFAYDRSSQSKSSWRNEVAAKYLQALQHATSEVTSRVSGFAYSKSGLDSLAEQDSLQDSVTSCSCSENNDVDCDEESHYTGDLKDADPEKSAIEDDKSPGTVRVFVSKQGFKAIERSDALAASALRREPPRRRPTSAEA